MDPEAMTVIEIKKYFTKNSNINFLNEFTLQDVEDAKKQAYMRNYKSNGDSYKSLLDRAAEKLAKDRFYFNVKEDQGVAVKNTVRDVLNANYKNTISRMILVDSQYRQNLSDNDTDFLLHFNEKVVNAISLEVTNLEIPYTFYNIESSLGNDHFMISTSFLSATGASLTNADGTYMITQTITLPEGHYESVDQITQQITTLLAENGLPHITCAKDPLNHRIKFTNTSLAPYKFQFLSTKSRVNSCLGWNLGFREYQLYTLPGQTNAELGIVYTLPAKTTVNSVVTNGSMMGTCVAIVPNPKYFVLSVEDFNQTQTADTMIQPNIKPENTKATSHFTQDPMLEYLLPSNLDSYLTAMPDRTLTKNQLYTIAQQNLEKQRLTLQNTRLEIPSTNQVLGMIPFEECKATWGSIYFCDKSKYVREYHSPTNLERLHIKLYDDRGNLLNLRGNSWCMTLTTHNLYKY